MITDALLRFAAWLVETVTGWMPVVPVPDWFASAGDVVGTFFDAASSMGVWLPLSLGSTVVKAVLLCVVVGFAIKVVRIIASFFTVGGGSAG